MKLWMIVLLCAVAGGCGMTAKMPPSLGMGEAPSLASSMDIAGMLRSPTRPEIWVIEQGAAIDSTSPSPRISLTTSDVAMSNKFPLLDIEVSTAINGFIARTDIVQHFGNQTSENSDATYEFRLPPDAAVRDFVITIGKREIRAVICARSDAEQIYDQALKQGYRATLIAQTQAGMITQKIANIPAGTPIDVKLTCFNALQYRDGWFEYALPLMTNDRVWSSAKAQINEGVEIGDIRSLTAAIKLKRISPTQAEVEYPRATGPSRDFVLQFNLSPRELKPALMIEHTTGGGYFALMMPALPAEAGARKPLDVILILDSASHVRGDDLELVKEIARQTVARLGPKDRVRIISVGQTVEMPAGSDAKSAGEFIDHLHAEGSIPIAQGIARAATAPRDPAKQRVIIIATDGSTLDSAALAAGRTLAADVGIACTQANPIYGEALARCCGGVVATVQNTQQAGEFANGFLETSGRPQIKDPTVDWPSASETCALGAGARPGLLTGKFSGPVPQEIHASAIVDGKKRQWTLQPLVIDPPDHGLAAIECIWAKMRITELADLYLENQQSKLLEQIKQIALDHSVISPMTSLLMVDGVRN